MATFSISATARKAQSSGNGSAGPFSFAFQVNAEAEVDVFVDTTLKTLSTHYTVSLSGDGTGSVSFTSNNFPTSSQTITIMGDAPLSRTSVYTSGGNITAAALESDFDTNVMVQQQQQEVLSRTVKAPVDDAASVDLTLPNKDARKGTVLGFNATSGNPEAGPSITAVQSLSGVTASINLLGTAAVVEDMGLLATSAVIEDMGLLSTSGNVSAMAKLGVDAVIADMAILGTDAIVADMAILGTNDVVADMAILATSDIVTDMNLLATAAVIEDMGLLGTAAVVEDMSLLGNAAVIEDMGLLATSAVITDMGILGTADVVSDMNTLASSDIISDLNTLATSDIVTDMNVLATSANVTAMGLLGTAAVVEDVGILGTSANVTAMSNVSGAIGNVNTVASNLSGIAAFASVYSSGGSDPSSNLDEGDLFYNTTSDTLKVYNGSSWVAGVTVGSGFLPLSGGQLSGNLTMAGTQTVDGRDLSADGSKLDTLATVGTTSITTLGTIGTGVWQGTAIASAYIAGDAITGAKIADNALNSEHYTDGSIDTAHIADGQITAAKMAANSVDSDSFVNGSIDTEHLADAQVTVAKMAANSVDSNQYVDGSIDTAHIADANVTQGKLADQAVNEAKMQVSNAPVNGYMLTAQSGNTGGLTWAAAPTSSTTYGAVGTYVFGRRPYTNADQAAWVAGTTYAGSGIFPAGLSAEVTDSSANGPPGRPEYKPSGDITVGDENSSALSGTWRAMGETQLASGKRKQPTTLFVRTA